MSEMNELSRRWITTEQFLEESNGELRECADCKKIKKGLYWCSIWLCGRCIEDSTIEGVRVGDEIIPRFTKAYQEIMRKKNICE